MFSTFSSKKKSSSKKVGRTQGARKASYSRRIALESLETRHLLAAVPILDYGFSIGGSAVEQAYDITRDAAGNIYVAGDFNGTVDFDPGATHIDDKDILTPAAGQDAFVAKYTAAGAFVWAAPLGMSNGQATFDAVAVDSTGNVFASGHFYGGDGETLSSIGPSDGVLAMFNSSGTRQWAKGFGSPGKFTGVNEVATDGTNVYAVGFLQGTVDFGDGWLLTTTGTDGGFVARFDSAGNPDWAGAVAGDGSARLHQIALDNAGYLVATGGFFGTIDLDPGTGESFPVSPSGGLVLKLRQADGAHQWDKTIGSGQTDGVAIDSQNNVVATGMFSGTTDFDPGLDAFELTSSGWSGFVWKLNSDGDFEWAKPSGSTAYKVAVDSTDNVYSIGTFNGRVDIDAGPETFYLDAPGSGDYVSKLDSSGEFVWARSMNADENNAGVVVDGSGNIFLAPTFSETVDFDPGPESLLLESNGESDFAIVRLSQGVSIDQVNLDHAFSFGGSGQEVAFEMAQDAQGNTYVVGAINDNAFLAKYTPSGAQAWFESLSGIAGVSAYTTVCVDTNGNVFAGGYARGGDTLSYSHPGDHGVVFRYSTQGGTFNAQLGHIFGNVPLINKVVADGAGAFYVVGDAADPLSFYVAHPDPSPNGPAWEREFTSSLGASSSDLAIDSGGNLLVSGSFEGEVDFNPGVNGSGEATSPPFTSSGFLLKLRGDGEYSWLTAVNGSNELRGIAIDSQDQIYVSGSATSSFDSGFIWKLNDGGGLIWARDVLSNPYHLAVDDEGAVYAVTRIKGRKDLDPALGTTFYLDAGDADALLKLDNDGNFAWARSFDNETVANHAGIAVDEDGHIFLAPTFEGSVDFDLGPQGFVLNSQGGSDFAFVKLSQGVILSVDTIEEDLGLIVETLQEPENTTGAPPADIKLSIEADDLDAVVAAIESVVAETGPVIEIEVSMTATTSDWAALIESIDFDPTDPDDPDDPKLTVPQGLHVVIVVTLADGDFPGGEINLKPGVRLVIDGANSAPIFFGQSPAFIVNSGDVVIRGVTFVNSTDAPTILVTGGSLVLRDSFVQETTGGSQAAIEITGGSVDLGSFADPGGNTIEVSGPGDLVRNLSTSSVAALGNVFQADGSTITDDTEIESLIFHGIDNPNFGYVTVSATRLFVDVDGNLQEVIDAAPSNATIFVAAGATGDYDAGSKLLTIAFENGPTVSQLADDTNPNLRTLTITGTPANDLIAFTSGSGAGVIQAVIGGFPTGSFLSTGRLIAYGENGNDQISVDDGIALTAILYGGEGDDELTGGAGHDLIFGGIGSDKVTGGAGNDFLIGDSGADRIVGSAGHDVLVAGSVAAHLTRNDLLLIAQQWAANRTEDSSTSDDVLDEVFSGFDTLTGSSGADWFIATLNDKVTDFKKQNKEGDVLTLV